jgi:hypothetical protein
VTEPSTGNYFLSGLLGTGPQAKTYSAGLQRDPWELLSHQDMMAAIRTNAHPGVVHVVGDVWGQFAELVDSVHQQLGQAVDASDQHWQGAASEAARGGLHQVADWLRGVADGATTIGRQQHEHAEMLAETQRQMEANPPVEFDVRQANAELQQITDPAEFAKKAASDQATMAKQADAHQRAVELMTAYDDYLEGAQAPSSAPVPSAPPGATNSSADSSAPAHTAVSDHQASGGTPAAAHPGGAPPVSTPSPESAATTSRVTSPHPEETSAAASSVPPGKSPAFTTFADPGGGSGGLTGRPGGIATDTHGSPPPGALANQPGIGGRAEQGAPLQPGRRTATGLPRETANAGQAAGKTSPGGKATPGPQTPLGQGARRKNDDELERRKREFTDLDTPEVFESDQLVVPPTIGVPDK